MDFQASVVRREDRAGEKPDLVEVRYGPDLGTIVSFIARAVAPTRSPPIAGPAASRR